MTRPRAAVVGVVAAGVLTAALAAPTPAAPDVGAHGGPGVSIQFQTFGPSRLDVLPGEAVTWTNVSDRRHTVDADNGTFSSGDLYGGATFTQLFPTVGAYPYHCTVHPDMVGEIDVRRVTLGPLPTAPVVAGTRVEFDGRTADPDMPVAVQRIDNSGPETVATAKPAADGTWRTEAAVTQTGDYQASTSTGVSESRRLIVSDRKVLVRATRTGVAVTVVPSVPYARIALQQYLREHFGWWPQARTSLDYVSEATFRVRPPARVRVVLLDKDEWTPLAVSQVVVVRPPRTRYRPG